MNNINIDRKDNNNSEPVKITCSGCSNRCYLKVYMKDDKVDRVEDGCCHRAVISARKQLEKK